MNQLGTRGNPSLGLRKTPFSRQVIAMHPQRLPTPFDLKIHTDDLCVRFNTKACRFSSVYLVNCYFLYYLLYLPDVFFRFPFFLLKCHCLTARHDTLFGNLQHCVLDTCYSLNYVLDWLCLVSSFNLVRIKSVN